VSADLHDAGALAAHAFGVLPEAERGELERHLAVCDSCRAELKELEETVQALDDSPEMLLDGPPSGGDFVVERALRTIRAETGQRTVRRRAWIAAAAAVAIVVAGTAGIAVERARLQRDVLIAIPPVATAVGQPSGTRNASAVDARTRAQITVALVPAAGWVRVNAAVAGIPAGERCRLWVVGRDGTRQLAGSWLVSERGAQEGTTLDGSALIDPSDVTAVEVDNTSGTRFVTVQV
jgi:Putative zinc-finger